MTRNKELFITLTIGIIFYLLIESFSNFVLYVSAFIYMNISNLELVLPWLIIYLAVIFGEIAIFSIDKIKKDSKLYILLFFIISLRILTQFYISSETYLLFNTALFISILIFFVEIFLLFKKVEFLKDCQQIIGGIIIGIGIQSLFFVVNISSNLSTDIFKIPFTFSFAAVLFYFNQALYNPKIINNSRINEENKKLKEDRKELNFFYFFLIGILFFLTFNWIINPMVLAAYDIWTANWFTFSFNFYILIILIALIVSFFIIRFIFMIEKDKNLKIIVVASNGIYCVLNCLAFFIIDEDFTVISPIYLTILIITGVFSIMLDISYLINFYILPSRAKTYLGLVIFIFSIIFSYALFIIISWFFRLSFLLTILILSIIYCSSFLKIEFKNLSKIRIEKKEFFNWNKQFGVFFLIIFGANLVPFIVVSLTRSYEPIPDGNPTFMIWNIHNAVGVDDKFDIDRIIDEIKKQDPDILGLNEVDMGGMKTSFIDITSYMAYKLNMYCYYGSTFIKHYGNAILSKYPFKEAENFALPCVVSFAEPRAIIRAKFLINSEVWTVYVNHLSTKHEDRLEQVEFIIELVEKSEFERVVWMGDFNFEPNSEEYSKINMSADVKFLNTHKYLSNTPDFTGGFDENNNPTKIIDYIMCSPDLIPTKAKVICSVASDHCAVLTEF